MAEIVGIDNVLNYCSKYSFQRIKLSRSGDVIFTRRQTDNETQDDILNDFETFIKDTIRPGNFKEYKLELFGTYNENPNAKLSPIVKIGVAFYDKPAATGNIENYTNKTSTGGVDVERYIVAATRAAELEAQIARLEDKIEELNEPDDDEQPEPMGIGAALNSALVEKLPVIIDYVLLRIAGNNNPAPAINGTGENVLTDFKKLHPDIENDLRRLYQLAQTKPDFFNMLIVQLRNMIE